MWWTQTSFSNAPTQCHVYYVSTHKKLVVIATHPAMWALAVGWTDTVAVRVSLGRQKKTNALVPGLASVYGRRATSVP